MLITEAQMGIGYSTDALALLENMQYLSEAESVYAPAMVPIVENKSLQANIIRLEDMTKFCESNYISDFGAALKAVCEASEVDPSTICFSVQEENVIADQDMAELVAGIMNEGVGVVAVPISESSDAYVLAEMATNHLLATEDASFLEAYVNSDFDAISAFLEADDKKEDPNPIKYDPDSIKNRATRIMQTVKKYAYTKPKEWLSNQIASLRRVLENVEKEYAKAEQGKKGIWLSIKHYISKALLWVMDLFKKKYSAAEVEAEKASAVQTDRLQRAQDAGRDVYR